MQPLASTATMSELGSLSRPQTEAEESNWASSTNGACFITCFSASHEPGWEALSLRFDEEQRIRACSVASLSFGTWDRDASFPLERQQRAT